MEICHNNCRICEDYTTSKERKQCPTYKLREKAVRASIYQMKKKSKLKNVSE